MGFNVLLVDDSAITRAMIGKTLRLADIDLGEVLEAGDGREALEVLGSEWVDLVIADLNMPVMSGTELVEKMRDEGLLDTIPVVVVSTEANKRRLGELRDKGVAAFVGKPFTPERIGSVVSSLLSEPPDVPVQAIEDSFFEALEGFAFLTAERLPLSCQFRQRPSMVATMVFHGLGLTGTLLLAVPADEAPALAASALGTAETTRAEGEDAVRELANVLCGRVLARLGGEYRDFVLSPPTLQIDSDGVWNIVAETEGTVAFDVEGAAMLVNVGLSRDRMI